MATLPESKEMYGMVMIHEFPVWKAFNKNYGELRPCTEKRFNFPISTFMLKFIK